MTQMNAILGMKV